MIKWSAPAEQDNIGVGTDGRYLYLGVPSKTTKITLYAAEHIAKMLLERVAAIPRQQIARVA